VCVSIATDECMLVEGRGKGSTDRRGKKLGVILNLSGLELDPHP